MTCPKNPVMVRCHALYIYPFLENTRVGTEESEQGIRYLRVGYAVGYIRSSGGETSSFESRNVRDRIVRGWLIWHPVGIGKTAVEHISVPIQRGICRHVEIYGSSTGL